MADAIIFTREEVATYYSVRVPEPIHNPDERCRETFDLAPKRPPKSDD
jgi:hypothetical protein